MHLSDFDYNLPPELIAQKPARPRDASRLMVADHSRGTIAHRRFRDIVEYLQAGDVLVINTSKVIPARLIGKKETGGAVEVFLVRKLRNGVWNALLKNFKETEIGKGVAIGRTHPLHCLPQKKLADGTWNVRFLEKGAPFELGLARHGRTPLPPYISGSSAPSAYQTVYAEHAGSVAAPTAGLHFTKRLLTVIKKRGVQICETTLHVGLGTFAPVRSENIKAHAMHGERAELSPAAAHTLNMARRDGRRIIAVGTTSVRVLESFSDASRHFRAGKKDVDIFIYPPYRFKAVDAMITNFHLPKSTLLMLVSAFAGRELIRKCYDEAMRKKYRFYSFGDAMLIH